MSARNPLVLAGCLVDRMEEGLLTEDREQELRDVFNAGKRRKVGYGSQLIIEVTEEQRADIISYLATIRDCELQIAGGAGDPEDANRPLIAAMARLEKREAKRL
jgi:hypothetical protein